MLTPQRILRIAFRNKFFPVIISISLICDNTTVPQLKMCDFFEETFKDFEVLYFPMSATKTLLLSNGEFSKLRYDSIPVKSASVNVSFSKNAKF